MPVKKADKNFTVISQKKDVKDDPNNSGNQETHNNDVETIPPESVLPKPGKETEVNIGEEIHTNTGPASEDRNFVSDQSGDPDEGNDDSNETVSTNGGGNGERFTVDQSLPILEGIINHDDSVFDPKIHCVDEQGNPRKTKSGKYRRRPGRKNGATNSGPQPTQQTYSFTDAPPEVTLQMLLTTMQVASLCMSMSLGKEMELSEKEQKTLADVYARYVHYKGWDNVCTPEAVVIGVSLSILGPKLFASGLIMKIFGKKKKVVNNAHSNIGTDGKRENNAGESNNNSGAGNPQEFSLGPPPLKGVG